MTTTTTTTDTTTSTTTTSTTTTTTTTTSTTTTTTSTTTTIALVDYEFMDGCDHLSASQVNQKWDGDSGLPTSIATGRVGGSCYRFNNASAQLKYTLSATRTTLTLCFAYKPGSFAGTRVIARFCEGGSDQIIVQTNVLGQVQVVKGITTLATSTYQLVANNWSYFEIAVTMSSTVGTAVIRVAQNEIVNLTGINSVSTSNEWMDQVKLGVVAADSQNYDFDDISMIKGLEFVGEMRIQTKLASGSGVTNSWSVVGAGSNYLAVNENAPGHDSDTSYVKIITPAGSVDLYALDPFSVTGQIMAVQVNVVNRKDDISSRSVAPLVRVGSTNYQGDTFNCLSGYRVARTIWKQSPATSSVWQLSELNASQAGQILVG